VLNWYTFVVICLSLSIHKSILLIIFRILILYQLEITLIRFALFASFRIGYLVFLFDKTPRKIFTIIVNRINRPQIIYFWREYGISERAKEWYLFKLKNDRNMLKIFKTRILSAIRDKKQYLIVNYLSVFLMPR